MTTKKSQSARKRACQISEWQPGPHIPGYQVRHSDILRQLEIDGTVVQFTSHEYQLLMLLLAHPEGSYTTFAQLSEAIYDSPRYDPTMRKNIGRRLGLVRSKLWPFGIQVVCLQQVGYTYITEQSPSQRLQTDCMLNDSRPHDPIRLSMHGR